MNDHKCRNQVIAIHNPHGPKYCDNCNHLALVDCSNTCQCCKLKIRNKKKFSELKTFDKIVSSNFDSISEWIAFPCSDELSFGWAVRIGIINYFVPVRYLAEFMELPNLEGDELERKFLENVKRECVVLGRYIRAIK